MKTIRLTKRQKEVMQDLKDLGAVSPKTAYSPCGADVQIYWNLEKKGLLKSIQKYSKNHPYRTGLSWGYEVRHYFIV